MEKISQLLLKESPLFRLYPFRVVADLLTNNTLVEIFPDARKCFQPLFFPFFMATEFHEVYWSKTEPQPVKTQQQRDALREPGDGPGSRAFRALLGAILFS